MCGIAGIVDRRGVPDRVHLEAARDSLAHRGPDDGRTYVSARGDAALLFRRLSIIDLRAVANQPLTNEDRQRWVVFNGEVYNFRSLRSELERSGHRFTSDGDAEVVLHAYEEWGEACVDRFVGMFAFAIWDETTQTLFAARDRLGIKPLYYQETPAGVRFASELKALVALPGGPQKIDEAALWQYLSRGYVSPPRTIYAEARSLSPGHCLTWSAARGSLRIERYWDPIDAYRRGRETPVARSMSDAADALDALLRESVRLRLISDVPIGAFLSGGVDSSAVVAMMAAEAGSRIRTFTIGFEDQDHNEAPFAKTIASHLGTDHAELYATERQALEFIPRLADHYDEPFADSSALPTYLVCLLARQHVTVALSGDGGDELFGGYKHYDVIERRLRNARRIPGPARDWIARAAGSAPHSRAQRAFVALPLASQAEAFFDYFTSLWRPMELASLAPNLAPAPLAPASRLAGCEATHLMTFSLSDLQRYLPDDILTKVDRASMAVSLEARVPLLDHRVVEFMLGLPDAFRRSGTQRKVLLRQVLARFVPDVLIDRPKKGFGVPLDCWLRGPLSWMIDQYLSPERVQREGVFSPAAVRAIVDRFRRGEVGHDRVWVLLVFQMWSEKYRAA
jgi:asparagine synthase (glutamine-hydrolysing)